MNILDIWIEGVYATCGHVADLMTELDAEGLDRSSLSGDSSGGKLYQLILVANTRYRDVARRILLGEVFILSPGELKNQRIHCLFVVTKY